MHRRQFIRAGSALAAALAAGSLVGCSDDDTTTTDTTAGETDTNAASSSASNAAAPTEAPAATPAEPTTARVGLIASPADSLNPATSTGVLDYAVLFAVHDSLVALRGKSVEFQLAESIEPNADGSEWTITLREGPTFHDGTPVTASDVVYSLGLYGSSPNYGQFFAIIDLANMSAPDDRTVVLPLVAPRADLIESVLGQLSIVVPEGFTDWGSNVGSGAFLLESYEQGVGASLVRNPDYWNGAPSLDRIELTAIADAATRARSLESGELDYVASLDAAAATTIENTDGVELAVAGSTEATIRCFAFNSSFAPFDDPRVVEACKLAIDREQMIDVVTFGNAQLGNDMPSLGFDGYPSDVPQRQRDIAQATALFAEAGVSEFTIRAADFLPGIVASAELYAQQLADCGVTATVEVADPSTYFDDFAQVLSTPCQAFYFNNRMPVVLLSSYTGSGAAFNLFGAPDATYDTALSEALATIDDAERTALIEDLITTVHNDQGWLIWGYEDKIDARSSALTGVELTQAVPVFHNAKMT